MYDIQVSPIKACLSYAPGIVQNDILPVAVPVLYFIVAWPVRIFFVQPSGGLSFPLRPPIVPIIFRFSDAEVRDDQASCAVIFYLKAAHLFGRESLALVK
jgi:hypothetical protein